MNENTKLNAKTPTNMHLKVNWRAAEKGGW